MKRTVLAVMLLATISLAAASAESIRYDDIGLPDTIRLGCPLDAGLVFVNDSIAIPIYLWNDDTVYAFSFGFSYTCSNVEVTSFDLTPGVIDPGGQQYKLEKYLPDENKFLIGWFDRDSVDTHWIAPTAGDQAALLGNLYLRVVLKQCTGVEQQLNFDSLHIEPGGSFLLAVDTATSAPRKIIGVVPEYVDGGDVDVTFAVERPCGDVDDNCIVNISDAIYLLAYIFGGGPAPAPLLVGDVNCDLIVNIADVVYLIAYIFGGGPPPCDLDNSGEFDCWWRG